MTSDEVVEKALRHVTPAPGPDGISALRTALFLRIPVALEVLAKRVAKGPGYEGMQKDFSATPSAGVVDLTALSGILFDLHHSKVKVASTGATLQAVDDLRTLEQGNLPSDTLYYAQDGSTLRVRSTTPSLTDYATALSIRANFVPTLSTLPSQYDGAFIVTLANVKDEAYETAEVGRA